MIIELTGIPGAGKSTFIKELEKTGNASNISPAGQTNS